MKYALGLDFGTESARAVLVDVATGETVATAVHLYADGVIDEALPRSDISLPPDWALQNPDDWLAALDATIPAVLAESRVAPDSVVGLGLDFTACTVLPTTAGGTPLCMPVLRSLERKNAGAEAQRLIYLCTPAKPIRLLLRYFPNNSFNQPVERQ